MDSRRHQFNYLAFRILIVIDNQLRAARLPRSTPTRPKANPIPSDPIPTFPPSHFYRITPICLVYLLLLTNCAHNRPFPPIFPSLSPPDGRLPQVARFQIKPCIPSLLIPHVEALRRTTCTRQPPGHLLACRPSVRFRHDLIVNYVNANNTQCSVVLDSGSFLNRWAVKEIRGSRASTPLDVITRAYTTGTDTM